MGIGVALASLALPSDNARSFVFDALSLSAAGAAVYGILRNEPHRRGVWQLFALGLALYAAGDVAFDVALRGFGRRRRLPLRRHPVPPRVPGARDRARSGWRARASTAPR